MRFTWLSLGNGTRILVGLGVGGNRSRRIKVVGEWDGKREFEKRWLELGLGRCAPSAEETSWIL